MEVRSLNNSMQQCTVDCNLTDEGVGNLERKKWNLGSTGLIKLSKKEGIRKEWLCSLMRGQKLKSFPNKIIFYITAGGVGVRQLISLFNIAGYFCSVLGIYLAVLMAYLFLVLWSEISPGAVRDSNQSQQYSRWVHDSLYSGWISMLPGFFNNKWCLKLLWASLQVVHVLRSHHNQIWGHSGGGTQYRGFYLGYNIRHGLYTQVTSHSTKDDVFKHSFSQ